MINNQRDMISPSMMSGNVHAKSPIEEINQPKSNS